MRIQGVARHLAFAFAVFSASVATGHGQALEQPPAGPLALLAAVEGPIGPGTVRHIHNVIATAQKRQAEVLILRLDTPGGLVDSMRQVISEIIGSRVPVIGYVAPGGTHAASAGTYILYATHIAAMAPGTNVGAATPVQIGGGDLLPAEKKGSPGEKEDGNAAPKNRDGAPGTTDTLTIKSVNDAVAFIRGLAELRHRNADWAEKAVREAASLPAHQALEMHVIDLMADDVGSLLQQIDGRTVTIGGSERQLSTAGARIEPLDADFFTRALSFLSDPNIAFLLMIIGVYGLIFEFAHPGAYAPGVIGAICLVLGLYALNQLPLDYAGLALVLLGIGFMIAEAMVPTFGALGIGGLFAFVVGAAMLIDTDQPAYRLSWWLIGGSAATSGSLLILVLGYVWRTYRKPRATDGSGMIGVEAQVLDWAEGGGYVWAHGERWRARGTGGLTKGQTVRVHGMDGLTLVVSASDDPASAGRRG